MSDSNHRGMSSREDWKRTSVHQASRYSCSKCGRGFASPQDVYDHLDAEHPKPTKGKAQR